MMYETIAYLEEELVTLKRDRDAAANAKLGKHQEPDYPKLDKLNSRIDSVRVALSGLYVRITL